VDILSNFSEFDDERLAEYLGEVREAFNGIADWKPRPTPNWTRPSRTPTTSRRSWSSSRPESLPPSSGRSVQRVSAAVLPKDSEQPPEEPPEEPGSGEDEDEEPEDDKNTTASDKVAAAVTTTRARGVVATLAKKVARPETPKPEKRKVTITAAADVPEFATGSPIDDLTSLGQAAINRMRGFPTPNGDGDPDNVDFHMYGSACWPGLRGRPTDHPQHRRRHGGPLPRDRRVPAPAGFPGRGRWLVCPVRDAVRPVCGRDDRGHGLGPRGAGEAGGIRYTTGPTSAPSTPTSGSARRRRRRSPEPPSPASRFPARRSKRSASTCAGCASVSRSSPRSGTRN
jgi:hypothetical protein